MIQIKDYEKLQGQLQELEQSMHAGNEQYDALRQRLNEIGKSSLEISKTTYWHWLTEKKDFPEAFFYNTPPIGEA